MYEKQLSNKMFCWPHKYGIAYRQGNIRITKRQFSLLLRLCTYILFHVSTLILTYQILLHDSIYYEFAHASHYIYSRFYLKYSEVFIRWELKQTPLKQKASLNNRMSCSCEDKRAWMHCSLQIKHKQLLLNIKWAQLTFHMLSLIISRGNREIIPRISNHSGAVTILWNAFLITPITNALCNLIRNQHHLSSAKAFCIYMWGFVIVFFLCFLFVWKPV